VRRSDPPPDDQSYRSLTTYPPQLSGFFRSQAESRGDGNDVSLARRATAEVASLEARVSEVAEMAAAGSYVEVAEHAGSRCPESSAALDGLSSLAC